MKSITVRHQSPSSESTTTTQRRFVYCQSRGQHAKLGAWPALSFGQRQTTYEVVGCLSSYVAHYVLIYY